MTEALTMARSAPAHGAPDMGFEDNRETLRSKFSAGGCDPRLARALREQLEDALSSTHCSIVMLGLDLVGSPLRAQMGATADDCEAIIESGFGTQQVIMTDLENDPRVPSSWRGRGFGASLSTPIEVDHRHIGVLHVLDTRSRDFSESHCEAIADIGYIIGKRVEKFLGPEKEERRESLMCRTVSPAFAELRNALVPLNLGTSDLRIVAADLSPVVSKLSSSSEAEDVAATVAFDDLVALIEEISRASSRVREVVMVVEDLWGEGGRTLMLGDVLRTAASLALHSTRLVGGVTMPDVSSAHSIVGRRSVAVAGLSLLLSRAAEANASGVTTVTPLLVDVVENVEYFEVRIQGENLGADEVDAIASEVDDLLLGDEDLEVLLDALVLCLRYTRAN
ncbi:MAG: GAF domain-containing protein [Myxococcales bacterium]|nr:GAF domain-containing protein [Myxococcales bacterium]